MEAQYRMLFESARALTDDDAGGHGNRWKVFDEDLEHFIRRWITVGLEKSQIVNVGVPDDLGLRRLAHAGELAASGLLYADRDEDLGKAGMLSLIALNLLDDSTGERRNVFYSAYPFFRDGASVEVEVGEIALFPNRLEARLELVLKEGPVLIAFDTLFWKHRARYRVQGASGIRPSRACLHHDAGPRARIRDRRPRTGPRLSRTRCLA